MTAPTITPSMATALALVLRMFEINPSGLDAVTVRCLAPECPWNLRRKRMNLAEVAADALEHWQDCHAIAAKDLYVLRCRYCHRSDRALRPVLDRPGAVMCIDMFRCLADMRDRLLREASELDEEGKSEGHST